MAGDWIKMRAELQTHPKVVRIMSALQADKLRVIGALHAVWCLFDTHSEDGKLDGYTPDAVDTFIGWIGFARAMLSVSWLEEKGQTLIAPRFEEHNGQSAKRRATNAKGKQSVRKMSASQADKTMTREEKRREEKICKPKSKTSALATRLPADWVPSVEDFEFCKTKRADLNPIDVADRFRDYWTAIPGSKGTKQNWPGTWRNWVRKENGTGGINGKQSRFDKLAEVSAALTGRTKKDNARTFDGSAERLD